MRWLLSDALWLARVCVLTLAPAVAVMWGVDRWAVAPLLEAETLTQEDGK
jgi:hypothetical protein